MENKQEQNTPISGENSGFSDTGSAIFDNFPSKTEENSEKIADFSVSSENLPENSENQPDLAEKSTKTEDLFGEKSISAFSKDFPDIDINSLRNRQDFQSFLAILTKNPTLSEIYACFNGIFASAEEKSEKKLLQALANAKTGVGALSSPQDKTLGFFTKEQVMHMSPSQIKAHYKEIRESQQRW